MQALNSLHATGSAQGLQTFSSFEIALSSPQLLVAATEGLGTRHVYSIHNVFLLVLTLAHPASRKCGTSHYNILVRSQHMHTQHMNERATYAMISQGLRGTTCTH